MLCLTPPSSIVCFQMHTVQLYNRLNIVLCQPAPSQVPQLPWMSSGLGSLTSHPPVGWRAWTCTFTFARSPVTQNSVHRRACACYWVTLFHARLNSTVCCTVTGELVSGSAQVNCPPPALTFLGKHPILLNFREFPHLLSVHKDYFAEPDLLQNFKKSDRLSRGKIQSELKDAFYFNFLINSGYSTLLPKGSSRENSHFVTSLQPAWTLYRFIISSSQAPLTIFPQYWTPLFSFQI